MTLYPPGEGSPPAPSFIPLGSWLMADPGPDYGAKGLLQSLQAGNALVDGGLFGGRFAPPRHMSLPLMVNAPYGVNHLANPGFETGTIGSWNNLDNVLFAAAGNATVGAVGSYYALASFTGASNAGIYQNITANAFLKWAEPMLFGFRAIDLSPSAANESLNLQAYVGIINAGGSGYGFFPDTAVAGYVWGYSAQGSPGVGQYQNMDLPNGQWVTIGGIFSPAAVGTMLWAAGAPSGGVPTAAVTLQPIVFTNGATKGAGSYIAVGLDEIEFRSAYRPRAIREWESQLRTFTTPGGFISVQPEGVPSAEAVFFDIIDGRWEPDYNIFHNRAGVRKGNLLLDTQPWGYWPTEITLASVASAGWYSNIAVNGGSVIGDVPALAHVKITPVMASVYGGSWITDMAAWGMGGKPSFVPFLPAPSFTNMSVNMGQAIVGNKYVPGSQAQVWTSPSSQWGLWNELAAWIVPQAVEPAWRGRFRAFALLRSAPSWAPWQVVLDVSPNTFQPAMASANLTASAFGYIANPSVAAISGGAPATAYVLGAGSSLTPSPGFGILDMGELTMPPAASGQSQTFLLRLWGCPPSLGTTFAIASTNASTTVSTAIASIVGTTQLLFGGVVLVPIDGAFGMLPRGVAVPSINNSGWPGGIELNANFNEGGVLLQGSYGPPLIPFDGRAFHRGIPLRVGASVNQFVVVTGDRAAAATYPVAQANVEYSAISVTYRPQFQFLYGG